MTAAGNVLNVKIRSPEVDGTMEFQASTVSETIESVQLVVLP